MKLVFKRKRAFLALFLLFTLGVNVVTAQISIKPAQLCSEGGNECFEVDVSEEKRNLQVTWSGDKGDGLTGHEYLVNVRNMNFLLSKDVDLRAVINETNIGSDGITDVKIFRLREFKQTDNLYDWSCGKSIPGLYGKPTNSCKKVKTGEYTYDSFAWDLFEDGNEPITKNKWFMGKRTSKNLVNIPAVFGDSEMFKVTFKTPTNVHGSLHFKDESTQETYHPFFNTTYQICMPISVESDRFIINQSARLNLSNANFNFSKTNPDLREIRFLHGNCTTQDETIGVLPHWVHFRNETSDNSTFVYVRMLNVTSEGLALFFNSTDNNPANLTNITTAGIGGDNFDDGSFTWSVAGGSFTESGGLLTSGDDSMWNGASQPMKITSFRVMQAINVIARTNEGDDQHSVQWGANTGVTGDNALEDALLYVKPIGDQIRIFERVFAAELQICNHAPIAHSEDIRAHLRVNETDIDISGNYELNITSEQDANEGCDAPSTSPPVLVNAERMAVRAFDDNSQWDFVFYWSEPYPTTNLYTFGPEELQSPPAPPDSKVPNVTNPLTTPSSIDLSGSVRINATVVDDVNMSVVLAEITPPNGTGYNTTMSNVSSQYNITVNFTIFDEPGNYTVFFIANDSNDNVNSSVNTSFVLTDITTPSVTNQEVTPASSAQGQIYTLRANVTDNIDSNSRVDTVRLNITDPSGDLNSTVVMTNGTANEYNVTFDSESITEIGVWTAFFIANDTANNINDTVSVTFTVLFNETQPPNVTGLSVTPESGNKTEQFMIRVNITDNNSTDTTLAQVSYPINGTGFNLTLVNWTGKQFNVTYTPSVEDDPGTYTVRIIANDTNNNINNSETITFLVNDTTPPSVEFESVAPTTGSLGTQFNISVNVTDNGKVTNSNIDIVSANVSLPNGSFDFFSLVNGSGNSYNFTFATVVAGPSGTYNVSFLANDTGDNFNDTISLVFSVNLVNDTINNNDTIEGVTSIYKLILNYSGALHNRSTALLERNNTNVTPTLFNQTLGGNIEDVWTVRFRNQFINNQTTNESITYKWIFVLNGSSVVESTTESRTQIINRMIISNCTVQSGIVIPALNWTFKDFSTGANLTANVTSQVFVWTELRNNSRQYGFADRAQSHPMCIYPTFATYNSSYRVVGVAEGFSSNTQDELLRVISNLTHRADFFLSKSGDTTAVDVIVENNIGQRQEGMQVDVFRQILPPDQFELISSKITDINGNVQFDLITDEIKYLFNVKNTTVDLLETDSAEITTTPLTLTVQTVTSSLFHLVNAVNVRKVLSELTYNNNTRVITLVYNDPEKVGNFNCINTIHNFTSLNITCSTQQSDTLTYTVDPAINGSIQFQHLVDIPGGSHFLRNWFNILKGQPNLFGIDGTLLTLFLVGTVAMFSAFLGSWIMLLFSASALAVAQATGLLFMSTAGFMAMLSVMIAVMVVILARGDR